MDTWDAGSRSVKVAERVYSDGELRELARRSGWRGFHGGAQWMAKAMGSLRSMPVKCPSRAHNCFGLLKYMSALGVCVAILITSLWFFESAGWLVSPLLPLVFYAIEVQTVFLFPLLIDGSVHPWRESRQLVVKSGGTVPAMVRVLRTAIHMLGQPLTGRNLVDSWCEGCLAVVIWYEEVRSQSGFSNRARGVQQDQV